MVNSIEPERTGLSNVEHSCMWQRREQAAAAADYKPGAAPMEAATPLACYWIKGEWPCAGGPEINTGRLRAQGDTGWTGQTIHTLSHTHTHTHTHTVFG